MSERERITLLSDQLERIWSDLDELLNGLDAAGWQRKHGPDWIFADLPYHLAYFDRYNARYLEAGSELPQEEQLVLDSFSAMAAWNDGQFALRPPGQTAQESLAEMHMARDRLRALMAGMTDADLSRPAWVSLTFFRGWRTAESVILVCLMHTWNEFMQLRIHMGREKPIPDPAITHMALGGFLVGMHALMDKEAAARQPLIIQYRINGPGGGRWTASLSGAGAVVEEVSTVEADLIFEQSVESFMKTFNGMHDPGQAIKSGEIKVQGTEYLPAYAALLPPPDPYTPFEALPGG
ncbi:MAG: DinB family protein [Candidatus Promineifilaceae bacterium]|nr:DinB family protein [Candidatus Promineifilaceae bacterium]